MGKVATSPLPSRGSPPLQSGGQNQKWPTCGQCGYVTPAVSKLQDSHTISFIFYFFQLLKVCGLHWEYSSALTFGQDVY